MDVLVANNHLQQTGGTENYTYAIIVELLKRGHCVEYFSFNKGMVSDKIEKLGVPFCSKKRYDIIIANHKPVVKKLFLKGFLVQTCHSTLLDTLQLEFPSKRADALVSISEEVSDVLKKKGFNSRVIWNGIDCQRFYPKQPLHDKLTSVLSLCQSQTANEFISLCCKKLGVRFYHCNKEVENKWNIEDEINKVDLVVGIGRSLYDAMACGRTVISYDHRDYSNATGEGYITKNNIEKCMKDNCTGRQCNKSFTTESFVQELLKYNPEDGHRMRDFAVQNLNIEKAVDHYLALGHTTNTLLLKKRLAIHARKLFYLTTQVLKK